MEEFELTIDMVVSCLISKRFIGVPAQDRRRKRRDLLLPLLHASGNGHKRQPVACEQLFEQQQGLVIHAVQLLREQYGQVTVLRKDLR